MSKSRFTDSKIRAVLKQNEAGIKFQDLCREYGISSLSVCEWQAKFGGVDVSLTKQMKQLKE